MRQPPARRRFVQLAAGFAAGAALPLEAAPAAALPDPAAGSAPATLPAAPLDAAANAANEAYWGAVAAQYDVAPGYSNLENGYYGVMARPVLAAYKRHIDALNLDSSYLLRTQFDSGGAEAIRAQVAAMVGAGVDEIALTRGATESMQNLLINYKPLKAGDTVMVGDLDYDAVQYAMVALAERRGASVAVVRMPEPATRQAIIDAYAQALERHPRTRLLLLTHVSHRTGIKMPLAELARMARARNVDVIVDAAQSWGQMDFKVADLHADFAGFNLHKWIGAPLGVGFLYIRKARLADIGVHMADQDYGVDDIRSRVHSGTVAAANTMTVPDAFSFHQQIGVANKAARLQYLRDYWVARVRDVPGIAILTPDDASMHGASTSFRLAGHTSKEANVALVKRLMGEHRVFTVARHGPVGGSCVRVTPALFTSPRDLDRLVLALHQITAG
jgi:isopenicillin-N epimerase